MVESNGEPLCAESLTWAALLAQWIDFARAAVALPEDGDGARWRESVAPIITLQAVTFALGDLHRVAPGERALARDKAEMLIREHVQALKTNWGTSHMPPMVLEVCQDARDAMAMSVYAGATELTWPGPGTMVMPPVTPPSSPPTDSTPTGAPQACGTLAVMAPGTIVMPGEPVAWWCDRDGLEIAGCTSRRVQRPRQVYRRLDEAGRVLGDVVAPIDADLPAGMPLLVPLLENGRAVGHFTMDAAEWEQMQRASIGDGEISVEEVW